jgi:xanthine dehydrogenase small subunit
MTRRCLQFLRRGRVVRLDRFSPYSTILDYLRLQERSTGTKEACAEGDCGACTVVMARTDNGRMVYEPVNSCIALLGQLDGAELITVEDLADGPRLHPVQAAMVRHHGSQCGFCTPGFVMSLFAHFHQCGGSTDRDKINDALAGNLCRCTGYKPIVEAGLEACNGDVHDRFMLEEGPRLEALGALADGEDLFVGDETSFYASPASEDELARLYEAHPDATIVAGATDVGLWITKKLAALAKIVDVNRVAELSWIEETDAGYSIGATVSLTRATPLLGTIDPDFTEIMRRFGSIQVRSRGTVGGNIANGSPIGDLAPMLIALGARVELRKGGRTRQLPLEDFFLDYGKQDRQGGEFVRRLLVPKLPPAAQFRAYKVSKRFDEDISAVFAAFCLTLADGKIAEARVAFGGMAGIPKRARSVEAKLRGLRLADARLWRGAADGVAADFTPLTDMRASAAYRMRVAGNLVVRGLAEIAGLGNDTTRIHPRGAALHAS